MRTRQIQCCDDALTEPRADAEISRQLEVRSVVVQPLLRDQELVGIFEIFSALPAAFSDHDLRPLKVLADRALKNAQARQASMISIGLAPAELAAASALAEANLAEDAERVGGALAESGSALAADVEAENWPTDEPIQENAESLPAMAFRLVHNRDGRGNPRSRAFDEHGCGYMPGLAEREQPSSGCAGGGAVFIVFIFVSWVFQRTGHKPRPRREGKSSNCSSQADVGFSCGKPIDERAGRG